MTISRYHIRTAPAPLPFTPPVRFHLQENDEYVKYGHPPFATPGRGDPYWTPEIISQTWFMAEKGRIPISGAGYGGAFAGPGFDAIWLDMSEIVRPTRDGIHGREYISTSVDVGRKVSALRFDAGGLAIETPTVLDLPLPVIFNPFPFPLQTRSPLLSIAKAAQSLHTLAVIGPEMWDSDLIPFAEALAPRLRSEQLAQFESLWSRARYIEIESGDFRAATDRIRSVNPSAIVGWRLPAEQASPDRIEALVRSGAAVIHVYADESGGSAQGFIGDRLQRLHRHLVAEGIRDEVTLIASGGIATAEHVPKAIVCGADLTAIDFTLLIAFGCGLWADKGHCAVEAGEFTPEWGAQRIVNLMAAWRDQLLECLGAMGMREVRRLRGETGRAIFQAKEEAEFKELFGDRHPAPPEPEETDVPTMGDLRWTPDLLQATWTQSATGQPPSRGEYRIGKSRGGFDVLRFQIELNGAQHPPATAVDGIDLALPLNRRPDGPRLTIPVPFYGGGMSFGSVSLQTMLARAMAAKEIGTFTSTGEGGYPNELARYADHVITQVATGLFGVREETIQRARFVEFKYAQGAKPGLGGHLLGGKTTEVVATMREAVAWTSLFSPFPFHSVYSVEDHKKHVDWIRTVHPGAVVSVKVSTPTDVDMVAVGIYYAGAHIVHLDGGYGGTGAAPEIAKKNIAMPIEYAIPKVHRFLVNEGIRDEIVLVASGGIRTAYDVAKCIALGADGAVIGMADLVALGCTRLADCEKGKGCPFGITTTDPEMSKLIDPVWGAGRIANLYRAWAVQLRLLLRDLGMRSIAELRGRTDLLVYLESQDEEKRHVA
jgi:glutamate synthase domain-containing protein 2